MKTQSEEYNKYVTENLKNYDGLLHPVKARFYERIGVKTVDINKLHPNPEDEFCDPEIGPNYDIVKNYAERFRLDAEYVRSSVSPIIVGKMSSNGYMILNGHHRWLAALMSGMKTVNIEIVNAVPADEIIERVNKSYNDKCVTFDFDSVVLASDDDNTHADTKDNGSDGFDHTGKKETRHWWPGKYKFRKHMRELINELHASGFDVWVYSGKFHLTGYIKLLFLLHGTYVDGVVCFARGNKNGEKIRKAFLDKYRHTMHVGNDALMLHNIATKQYESFDIDTLNRGYASEVMAVIRDLNLEKIRVSFDLDEVLFVSPDTHKTEPPLKYPYSKIYKERLRLGTPELIQKLHSMGIDVWVYTSSYRTEKYIRNLFRHYGVRFNGIVNAQRHLKEVQGSHKDIYPQKMPSRYRISLHIDDESVIATNGRAYGFEVYELNADDDNWMDKIIERVEKIRIKSVKKKNTATM